MPLRGKTTFSKSLTRHWYFNGFFKILTSPEIATAFGK